MKMAEERDKSKAYFSSYGDLSVHELMLKDKARTLAYKHFIDANKSLFKDKVVLDVGAGTGILSLFAASAGARKVFAVEASEISELCEKIVECNNLNNQISVIKGTIEDIELPVKEVDIIISEWMGFYLLHESMLESVLFARDKWLSRDGIMVPSQAILYIAPVNMTDYVKEHFRFYENVYGFDFSPMQMSVMTNTMKQPVIIMLKPEQCLASASEICDLDLKTMSCTDITSINKSFTFTIEKSGLLHGYATWFDVHFSADKSKFPSVQSSALSTSPNAQDTHWKQTVCFLPSSPRVSEGEINSCVVELFQDENNQRLYNISMALMDSEEEDGSEDSEDFDEEEDVSDHPVPCHCGASRCMLIKALMEKYDYEQSSLEHEAEVVDLKAEVEAAKTVDIEAMENGDIVTSDGDSSL